MANSLVVLPGMAALLAVSFGTKKLLKNMGLFRDCQGIASTWISNNEFGVSRVLFNLFTQPADMYP